MKPRIRIGAVSYLNTKPLVHRLEQFAPQAQLVFDLPSRLSTRLANGELDVALIPCIDYFDHADYHILSDACIGCRGPVLSVKLYFRVSPSEVTTLALDEGSRTSAAMARILLSQRYGLAPQLESLPIGMGLGDTTSDAVLLIGDRAIHSPPEEFVETWDLGEHWCRWSELPFVFAMWTARGNIDTSGLAEALSSARDAGLEELDSIVKIAAPMAGMTTDDCLTYLRDNLYFYLGAPQRKALQFYYNHALGLDLVPSGGDLKFNDYQATR